MSKKLIANVAEKTGMTQTDTKTILDAILSEIKDELYEKTDVSFFGFGKFCTSERKARKGRNPATGEEIQIKATTQIKFKPSSTLKTFIND
ncbi:MAG: HU family DNA-binding protein [Candidatus Heimdallarchaeota archaeon]